MEHHSPRSFDGGLALPFPPGATSRLLPAAAPALDPKRRCLECDAPLLASAAREAEFCCAGCRKDWNNRRYQRGAQLYDLFMCLRFERKLATLRGVWTMMCSLARAFRDADNHARGGRRSWRRIDRALADIPQAFSHQGDKR